MFAYTTNSVCSKRITFNLVDDHIQNVSFEAGCPGNLIAISRLVEGMQVDEAIEKLKGIPCGSKTTSCADQLSMALSEAKAQQTAS